MLWCLSCRGPPPGIDHRNTDFPTIEGQGCWAGIVIKAPRFSDAGRPHDAHYYGHEASGFSARIVVLTEDNAARGTDGFLDVLPVGPLRISEHGLGGSVAVGTAMLSGGAYLANRNFRKRQCGHHVQKRVPHPVPDNRAFDTQWV